MDSGFVIVADWGSSKLRAHLCQIDTDDKLVPIDVGFGLGVTKVNGQFQQELESVSANWILQYGEMPILLSGQIGANIGWHEAPYVRCPAKTNQLADHLYQFSVNDMPVYIVPGMSCMLDNDTPDVMRGEELQVMGWLAQKPERQQGQHLLCLPGTHTKWVLVNNGQIEVFKTSMTGELYELLSSNSVLIQTVNNTLSEPSFMQGIELASRQTGFFSHGVFSVRTRQLFGQLNPEDSCSYLSGILVGADVRGAVTSSAWNMENIACVHLIGATDLVFRFELALKHHDVDVIKHEVEEVNLAGYQQIIKQIKAAD
ncbi:2-dehydro-3-deoxygalactonokinase [Thalassotalea sp. HSM 43]|uniref:2-dehydro-3-deoxygalactonokinase n=1 Tax=Thalassotalea sp. HSM 43 TaxID=2552945 RepID=UPI0010815BC2|nr:2-dehydro-3-deoxygalactonokinase [Thalassotalea sp. HSM 43]QBY04229.1 2-dehydro-3-deoxygalactonokinase [Thalassotalea sp. HSM 43]